MAINYFYFSNCGQKMILSCIVQHAFQSQIDTILSRQVSEKAALKRASMIRGIFYQPTVTLTKL